MFHLFNSLLPVSRYIDTPFADKGSDKKKQLEKLEAAKAA